MDDKMPKCGCGGNGVVVRHGKRAPHYWSIVCGHCVISTHTHETTEAAIAVWTRAMSAQAPGMEAMRDMQAALISVRDDLRWVDDDGRERIGDGAEVQPGTIDKVLAALQAAERGKA